MFRNPEVSCPGRKSEGLLIWTMGKLTSPVIDVFLEPLVPPWMKIEGLFVILDYGTISLPRLVFYVCPVFAVDVW